ncbi:MAG: nitrous oxide reductase accessory protein NosL [Trueperaceae bacterium]|nr:nitrous oxide reductase accessory protein NosL [Trueperaceae bacterium]
MGTGIDRRTVLRMTGYALGAALLGSQRAWADPRAIAFGVDVCPYCSMTVVDLRVTAQVVTPTGLVHHYDAIECLADHLMGHGPTPPDVAETYLANRAASTREDVVFLHAEKAVVLCHARLRPPLGGGLAAFADRAAAVEFAAAGRLSRAEVLSWSEVLERGRGHPWVPEY